MAQQKYTVLVDDNFHHGDESERFKLGDFDDCASAVAACKELLDEFIRINWGQFEDLFVTYVMFGDDPFIVTDDPNCKFSARDYVRERVDLLAKEK